MWAELVGIVAFGIVALLVLFLGWIGLSLLNQRDDLQAENRKLRMYLQHIAGYERRYLQEVSTWSSTDGDVVEIWRSAYARMGAIARQGLEDNS